MHIQGDFGLITPAGLIQILCQEERTVQITAHYNQQTARIVIVRGMLAEAELGHFVAVEAICHMLFWERGSFTVAAMEPPAEHAYIGDWEGVILEAARRRDEFQMQS